MKSIKFFILISLIIASIGCEPIKITTKVKPFEIEPPKEIPATKKLSHNAIVLINDEQRKLYTYNDWNAGVIYEVEFPTGNLLRQVLPLFFEGMFKKVTYSTTIPSTVPPDSLIITPSVNTLNFIKKCCPEFLNINVYTEFRIYDADLIEVAIPLLSYGEAKMTKPGIFAYIDEKDYGNTAYQAIFNSLKKASDEIYEAITNPRAEILKAKQLITKEPSNTKAYKVIANLSLKNKDVAEAMAASQMYVQLAPKDPDGYFILYKCYLSQRKYKDALSQLEQAISLAPQRALFYAKLYEFYTERGKYERAIDTVKRYIEQKPIDHHAPLKLALVYFKMGKYEEVVKISEKALNNLSFSGIGVSIMKNENEYARIKSVETNSPAHRAGLESNYEIIEIDGKSTLEMKLNDIVGKIRGQEGTEIKLKVRKAESGETFSKLIVREKFYTDPVAASYMGIIALSYLELNDKAKGKYFIEEAQKIDPQSYYVKFAKAYLYLKDTQYDKAINELASIKDVDYALLIQAIAQAKMGKYEESLNLYKRILNSKDLLITNRVRNELFTALYPYLEKIESRAIEYEKAGKYGQALREYARLLEISDSDKAQWIRSRVARVISQNSSIVELKDEGRKYFLHAEVLFTNSKFEEAIEELDKASKIQPFNPQIYFNKAILYEKISDYAKAVENMDIYLQLNPHAPNAQAIRDQIYKWRFILEKES